DGRNGIEMDDRVAAGVLDMVRVVEPSLLGVVLVDPAEMQLVRTLDEVGDRPGATLSGGAEGKGVAAAAAAEGGAAEEPAAFEVIRPATSADGRVAAARDD